MYSSFLQSVNGVIIIDLDEHLPTVGREHCLRSTSSLKPDYVFFKDTDSGAVYNSYDQDFRDRVFSLMSDLDTVVVTCYGDIKSVNGYPDLFLVEFFIKKVGHRFVFCLTGSDCTNPTSPKFIQLLTSLISVPESSLKEPNHKLQNHDVCNCLQLTEKTSDQTLTHSLSYLREIVIEDTTSELVSLLNILHHVPRLSELFLHGVGMGNQECQLLATALKNGDKLRFLGLSCNPLDHGISELAKHLHSVPHLEKLQLNDTQIGEEEVTALALSLKNVTQLSELVLSNNPLGNWISELAKHLHFVPHLEWLHLGDTQMGEEEVTALALSLINVTQLSELVLSKNPLSHGIIELAKHLHNVPHLCRLDLNNTQMGEDEVTSLAHVLVHVPQLDTLRLDKNPLKENLSNIGPSQDNNC